ncbi:MAG: hypothetical protein VX527_04035, partial [Planctomycetota bacterium]|nr:hypothetical protein [Planctomycetota bacterium]
MKTMWVLLSAAAVCGLLSGNLYGATINVPGDYASIQEAVDASSEGDEIVVGPGTYTSTQDGHVVDMKGRVVTLRSSDGPEVTIIDGENARRGIACINGEVVATTIDGFTITNGEAPWFDFDQDGTVDTDEERGGGLLNLDSSPTVLNCVFRYNSALNFGGGISNNNSSPSITDCLFEENSSFNGAGVSNYDGNAYLLRCSFINNEGGWSGGAIINYGNPTMTACTFEGNTSVAYGGAVTNMDGSAVFTNCTFENNYCNDHGGAIRNTGSNPRFTNCNFRNNDASDYGGAIYNDGSSVQTLTNCILIGNSALFINGSDFNGGGGIYNQNEGITILNGCNVCGNTMPQIQGDWVDKGLNYVGLDCIASCCLEDYECIPDITESSCEDQGGFWYHLIDCDDEYPCGVPEGACCLVDWSLCVDNFSESACNGLNGTWYGPASTCQESECAVGACCYSNDICYEQIQPICLLNDGNYLGADTLCDDFDCSNLESACCFGYECQYLAEDDCESQGGYTYGYNLSCDEVECGPPGGCCFENSCEELVEFECLELGGFFQGTETTCDEWWTCPVVSCCFGSSNYCYDYTPDYCVSIGGDPGDSSCGDWDPCVERGSCCLYGYGECYDWTTQDECDSVDGYWIMSGECQWAPCMRGNCCVDGECMQLFYVDCMAWGGDYSPPVFGGCDEPGYYCARTLVVDASGNGDYLTIQEAVDEANDTDTVLIRAGTYTGSGDASVPVVDLKGKAIHLQGEPKRVGIIYIDGESQRPCIVCNNGESSDTIIELVECINGSAEKGGALYCLSSPTITNCAFRDSSASVSGGGVYIEIGEPTLTDCEVTGNDSPYGGGFYILDSNTSITGGLIGTNSASNRGGGLRIYRSSPVLTNVDIQGNWATRGGAAHSQEDSVPVFDSCMITGNMADSLGGGLATSYNSPAIYRGCTFTGNQATGNNGGQGSGGAIYSDNSPVVVENCLIDGNTADTYGGGIYCWYSSPVVTGTTIKGNTSGASGGAIRTIGGTGPSLDNDILCGNSPDNVAGPWDGAGDNCLAESCQDNNGNELPDECECEGDTNEDGVVDITDLLAILDGWGGADGDVTGDGDTNIDDILVVLGNWGFCS